MKGLAILLLALGLGCRGADGPMGPPGESGPGTRLVLTTTIWSGGGAAMALPTTVGTNPALPPAMSCYLRPPDSTMWRVVADGWGATTTYCGLTFANGTWNVFIFNATPDWIVMFVIVY